MTDTTSTTEDLELFDDAKEEFPGKEDLRDRLVAIFVTGKHGKRKSETGNGNYDWVETITVVLDDGPNFTGMVIDGNGEQRETLVGQAPQRLDGFQWSAGGITARLLPRIGPDGKPNTFQALRGRINSRPNAKKGFSPSWSISKPTDEDKAASLKHAGLIRQIAAELQAAQTAADESAFE